MDIFESLKTHQFNISDHDPHTKWGMGFHSPHTEETKQLISMSKKGTKQTEEHKEKVRLSRVGFKQPDSQKNKVSKALSKEWLVINPKGETLEITNLRRFCKENGLDQGNMVKVSKGQIKQNKGWKCLKL